MPISIERLRANSFPQPLLLILHENAAGKISMDRPVPGPPALSHLLSKVEKKVTIHCIDELQGILWSFDDTPV